MSTRIEPWALWDLRQFQVNWAGSTVLDGHSHTWDVKSTWNACSVPGCGVVELAWIRYQRLLKRVTSTSAHPPSSLDDWWVNQAAQEASQVAKKAAKYGSNSLMAQGRRMARLQGRQVSDEEALELGCWDYAAGKLERWTDAVMRGERPEDDTIYDIGVYARMVLRIREVGGWPDGER